MGDFGQRFVDMLGATALPQQILEYDIAGLARNPWFMAPFCLMILWMIYRKAWRNIAIVVLLLGLWWFSGSEFMDGTIVDGKPVLFKLAPVVGVFVLAVVIMAYLLFL